MKSGASGVAVVSLLRIGLIGPLRSSEPTKRAAVGGSQGMQGVWRAVSVEGSGVSGSKRLSLVVTDSTLAFRLGGEDLIHAIYTPAPTRTPSGIDLSPTLEAPHDSTILQCFRPTTGGRITAAPARLSRPPHPHPHTWGNIGLRRRGSI